jgi:hypothetical protein
MESEAAHDLVGDEEKVSDEMLLERLDRFLAIQERIAVAEERKARAFEDISIAADSLAKRAWEAIEKTFHAAR